jgi:hypothetical protein
MKKLRILLLPAALILIGAGAAFATNVAKSSSNTADGYFLDSSTGQCVKRGVCSNIPGNTCMWDDGSGTLRNLSKLSGTSCSVHLAKLPD